MTISTTQQQSAENPAPVSSGLVMLPVGTRIRFLRTLAEAPTGDHPALLYAEKGEGGEVTGHGCTEGHWVKTDKWKSPFGAVLNVEFEDAT